MQKRHAISSQVEQLSILSNIFNYIKYDRHPKNFYNLNIRAANKEKYKRKSIREKERQMSELDFGDMQEKLKEEYLDIYDRIQSEILSTTRLDENSNLSTTYLERVDMTRASKIKAEEKFPISEQGYTVRKVLDGTDCQILLDTGAKNHLCLNHTICAVSHFIHYQNLHLKHKEFKQEMDNSLVYCS